MGYEWDIPSGKHTKNDGNSTIFTGKTQDFYGHVQVRELLNYQRGTGDEWLRLVMAMNGD